MGSARVSNAKPIPMETTDKKSIKTLIKSFFHKKKEKPKIEKKENVAEKPEIKKESKPIQNTNTVANILESFNKLNLEETKQTVRQEIKEDQEVKEEQEDELENFTFKVIEESRNERIHSQSSTASGDSGFSDNKDPENCEKTENDDKPDTTEESEEKTENEEQTDDLAEDLEKLRLDEDAKKKKKIQTVVVSRAPVRNKLCNYGSSPYPTQDQDSYNKISSINKHTLSGGQVLVNQAQSDNFSEVKLALESVQKNSQFLQNDRETYLQDVMELINEDTKPKSIPKLVVTPEFDVVTPEYDYQEHTNIDFSHKKLTSNAYLGDYEEKTVQHNELMQLLEENYQMSPESLSNPVDQFGQEEFTQIFNNYVQKEYSSTSNDGYIGAEYTFPTPPRSETVPSPMSNLSPASFYPSNSECTFSPGRSPIYNSDYEKYQDIPHFEEEKEGTDKKERERTPSVSSMTMKQFKDMQKEIVYNFSKRDCCQVTRKTCKELLQEHLQKVNKGVRKNLFMEVSKIDLKQAYGVLHHILLSLSTTSDKEDVQYGLFGLVCERMLAQDPAIFVGDAGLSLLKSAALRCPHRPLLTRYLVQCIRTAIKCDAALQNSKEHIFHEVDALGDNLVIACARAGDRCSEVLSELVRVPDNQAPLFKHNHINADGYTALHVACSQHSASNPRLHTVHVLLAHAGFDITDGDQKGGDTALHLAVNSANCDLQLVLMMFNQLPRKEWKSLAHHPNLSTKTPLDLARLAAKTTTRQNYPQEVLDFLKKCR